MIKASFKSLWQLEGRLDHEVEWGYLTDRWTWSVCSALGLPLPL
jgi:hypothetical protein